jgi:hypothetical protein
MKYYHPNIAAVEMDLNHFNDTLMTHFWRVKKSRIKQSTLDSFESFENKYVFHS